MLFYRLGWALSILTVAIPFVWGSVLATVGDFGLWSALSTGGLYLAIVFCVTAAYHRGRASAWKESRELHDRFVTRRWGNGGRTSR